MPSPPFSSQLIHWGEWISVPLVIAVGFWLIVIITFALNMAFTFVESLCPLKTSNRDVSSCPLMVGCDVPSVLCITAFIIAKIVGCERDRHLSKDGRFMPPNQL